MKVLCDSVLTLTGEKDHFLTIYLMLRTDVTLLLGFIVIFLAEHCGFPNGKVPLSGRSNNIEHMQTVTNCIALIVNTQRVILK